MAKMPATTLSFGKVSFSYFRSLFWVAVLVASAIFCFMATDVTRVDFLNINPHRSQSHAASLPFIFGPLFLILSILGIFITFSIAQIAQALISRYLAQQVGRRGYWIVAAATPLMAILSWYCYDYLTPSDLNLGINEWADWAPYQHGLTAQRFWIVLGLQSFVTAFSAVRLRFEIGGHNLANRWLLVSAIGFASVVGVVGEMLKQGQM